MKPTELTEKQWQQLLKTSSWKQAEWQQVMELAKKQQGLVSRSQVLERGFSTADWSRLLRVGWLLPYERGVYEVMPGGRWLERRLHTAVLTAGEGAVVSHRAAARLFGLWAINGNPVELTVSRRIKQPGAILHRRALPTEDVIWLRGLQTTSLVRTVIDLASVLDEDSLAAAFEMARRRDPKVLAAVESRLAANPEEEGAELLTQIIEEMKLRKPLLDSPAEVWAWRWMLAAQLEMPEPHFEVSLPGSARIEVDFAYPKEKLGIEVLGFGYHGSKDRFERDAHRATRLSKAGWIIVHVTFNRLVDEFHEVLTEIRTTLASQRAAGASRK